MVSARNPRRLLLLLLLVVVAVSSSSSSSASRQQRRASTAAFLPPTNPCSTGAGTNNLEPQPPAAAAPIQVAAIDKALPLSRRCRRPSSSRRNALPPFNTPLDPAAIEAMVQQAQQQAQTPLPQGMGEVSTEQLWVGFVAGVFPFVWAAYEFWKRIDTQQRCGVCQGSGLVYESRSGRPLEVPRKCFACGGFLPWMGWRRFWLSNLDVGNGGVLQRPAADYDALSAEAKEKRRQRQQQGEE